MKTILENYVTEIEVERSRFIALLFPLKSEDEVSSLLEEVKKEYRNARHYCYAYRFNDSERASDDGEPKGTAGRPMLDLLQKNDLQHVLLVVVRYFGGILLGAGRLLRTYVASGKAVLGLATIVPIQTVYKYQFKIDVDELDNVYSLQIYIIFLLNQVLVKEVLLSHLEQMKISHLCLKQIFMIKK